MADQEFECPGCGQWRRIGDQRAYWYEARARTQARLDPSQRSAKYDYCRICGEPLPKRRRSRKDKDADVPTVLPVEEADDAADVPEVPPADDPSRPKWHPRRSSAAKDCKAEVRPSKSRTGGLSPFLGVLIGVGMIALVLLPLALRFFIPAVLLAIVGFATTVVGFIWSWDYYSRYEYERPSAPIRILGGNIARLIYDALNALQDPLGIGRPFLLKILGLLLLLIGMLLSILNYEHHHTTPPIGHPQNQGRR